MHAAGIAHRDLKLDNLLLNSHFNIKIADFGLCGPIEGRYGTGWMKTVVGTMPFMAPEIILEKPYKGEAVDLFSAAVILFVLVAGTPPFSMAKADDDYYKTIVAGKWETFWKYHIRGKPGGAAFFSDNFKSLMNKML